MCELCMIMIECEWVRENATCWSSEQIVSQSWVLLCMNYTHTQFPFLCETACRQWMNLSGRSACFTHSFVYPLCRERRRPVFSWKFFFYTFPDYKLVDALCAYLHERWILISEGNSCPAKSCGKKWEVMQCERDLLLLSRHDMLAIVILLLLVCDPAADAENSVTRSRGRALFLLLVYLSDPFPSFPFPFPVLSLFVDRHTGQWWVREWVSEGWARMRSCPHFVRQKRAKPRNSKLRHDYNPI